MDGFKKHSPKQVDTALSQNFGNDELGLADAVSEISIDDFREYMAFMGLEPPISPDDLAAASGWPIEQARKVFALFNKRLRTLAELKQRGG